MAQALARREGEALRDGRLEDPAHVQAAPQTRSSRAKSRDRRERDPSTSAFGPKFILSAAAKPQAEGLGANGEGVGDAGLADLRFARLLGGEGWARLPAAVRARFAKRYAPGKSVSYAGVIAECRMSRTGWALAHLCRLIGAPLPLTRGSGLAAVVTVTEHGASGGQVWTRVYSRPHGFPQVIHSAKMFAGPTGLEEYLGLGIGVALTVAAESDRIVFYSDHYFLRLMGRRLRLPRRLTPGALRIGHIDHGQGAFAFVLDLVHPVLGELIHQHGEFHDMDGD